MQAWMNIFQEVAFVWSNGQTRPRHTFHPQISTLNCGWSPRQIQPQSRPLGRPPLYLLRTVKRFVVPPAHAAAYV